jgi:hypothetical protein
MFERYVEKARRCIYFARYEASVYGSPVIETEHLLLGMLREDKELVALMSLQESDVEVMRRRIESFIPRQEPPPSSVDMPLSSDCKRALSYGAEEADKFDHKTIDPRHLMLGLLRVEGCRAASVLREIGITYEAFADMVGQQPDLERPVHRPNEEFPETPAEALRNSVDALQHLVGVSIRHLHQDSHSQYGDQRLKRRDWTRKEAMGHLIDWATAHHQWFGSAMVEAEVIGREYPQEEHAIQRGYRECSWPDLVDAWVSLNRIIIRLLARMPDEKVTTPCRIGVEKPIPLSTLAEHYALRNEDLIGQILTKL